MSEFKLLDCTLRDGGYINNWDFGYQTIKNIIHNLVDSHVDYIEIGFLRNCEYDKNKTLYNNVAQAKNILPKSHQNTKFVLMCLHNLYDIQKLEPCDGTIEYVRVTFHDYDIEEGLAFCKKVIEKGYKCFCNPINIMGYSDERLLWLIQKINELSPYAFSIVDTFGSMTATDLMRIYYLVEHNLNPDIVLGLHLHENLSLAYSLAQKYTNIVSPIRKSVIDASMQGMGRVPGNLCMELIMDYMNKAFGKNYDINPVLDGIDDYIARLKSIEAWGYSTAYALSAQYNLHRNYSEFFLNKGKLRAKQINQLLASIEDHKKTAFDKDYAEQLYQNYQNIHIDDTDSRDDLKQQLKGKKILLLAPGATLNTQRDKVVRFIDENSPVIIAVNFSPEQFHPDYIFFSNSKRLEEVTSQSNEDSQYLITSNLSHSDHSAEHVFNYYDLAYQNNELYDNSAVMLMHLLQQIGVEEVYLAGMDGYEKDRTNYSVDYIHSHHIKDYALENKEISTHLRQLNAQMPLHFLTATFYQI